LVAGFLYGPIWGGIWATIGLWLGSMLAMWLARQFGRPLAERLVGAARLDRWEKVTHSTSPVVWFVLLLGPTGDVPYYLAGLSHVSYLRVFTIVSIVRVPSAFVTAALGSGVVSLTWWQLMLIFGGVAGILMVFVRYQESILAWTDKQMVQRISNRFSQSDRLGQDNL
jgi:uncharacterized membrane protein YdjX (TVP38/TMEM64 family)